VSRSYHLPRLGTDELDRELDCAGDKFRMAFDEGRGSLGTAFNDTLSSFKCDLGNL
jgi:hypothetical protein